MSLRTCVVALFLAGCSSTVVGAGDPADPTTDSATAGTPTTDAGNPLEASEIADSQTPESAPDTDRVDVGTVEDKFDATDASRDVADDTRAPADVTDVAPEAFPPTEQGRCESGSPWLKWEPTGCYDLAGPISKARGRFSCVFRGDSKGVVRCLPKDEPFPSEYHIDAACSGVGILDTPYVGLLVARIGAVVYDAPPFTPPSTCYWKRGADCVPSRCDASAFFNAIAIGSEHAPTDFYAPGF